MNLFAIFVLALYALVVFLLFLLGFHQILMVLLYRRNAAYCVSGELPPIDPAKKPGKDIPVVTIQLPIFNEFYVVDRLIESVCRVRWPKKRLEIQILDDSTDETREKAAALAASYRRQGFDIKHIHRTNREGHKAGALRAGLEVARGDYIAVFDADFVPDPDFLTKTIPYFKDPDIGMIQTRWGHINADYSFLTRAQSIGIDGHFMIEQVARNSNQLWMNFNGTGGVWRRECIIEAGNWQSDTLTEDFDLSYRAELAGWKFRYFRDVVNPAELPGVISAFKSQQFRWCKGSIQTAVKLIPRILKSDFNWKIKAEALTHLLNYSVHPLMILSMLLTLPLLLINLWSVYDMTQASIVALFAVAAFMSVGTFGPLVFYLYSQRALYDDWKQRALWLPFFMMMGVGIAVSNTKAWLEALAGKKSSFQRTPKLRIEKRGENLRDRDRYRLPLDPLVFLELAMAFYCTLCAYLSVEYKLYLLTPFMLLYAGGFYYVVYLSLVESFGGRRARASEASPAGAGEESAVRAA